MNLQRTVIKVLLTVTLGAVGGLLGGGGGIAPAGAPAAAGMNWESPVEA